MQSNTHRITIEAFLIPTLNRTAGPENDPACAAFVFGILRFAWRYAGALRIGNLAIVRKGLTMEVRGEPPADFLAELQRLGDEFEVATTAKGQAPGDFEPRVTVERLAESVAGEVIDAWAHAWGLQPEAAANLRKLVVAVARRALGGEEAAKEREEFGGWLATTFQPGHVDEAAVLMPRGEYESGAAFCRRVLQLALDRGAFSLSIGGGSENPVAVSMWERLEAIEKTDPTDTEMSKVQFRGTVRELAHRRHDLMTEEAARAGKTMSPWTAWARTVLGCDDGADAELQALIGRMLDTAKKLRRQNQLAFDALASGPLPMVAPSHPLDAQMATTADVAERARAAASNLRYAMGHPQESPDPTPAAMQDAVQVLTVAAAVLGATQADPSDAPRG